MTELAVRANEDIGWLPSIEDYGTYIATLPPPENIALSDGRTLTYREFGPEDGLAVVALHGNPGSSASFGVFGEILTKENVRMIAIDRAGSGGSTQHEGLFASDTARDVQQVLDFKGIRQCGLIAVSGGVPHGVGCLALLGIERITAGVGMAGLAFSKEGVGFTDGMVRDNQLVHDATRNGNTAALTAFIRERVAAMQEGDPFGLVKMLLPDLRPSDIEVLMDKQICSAVAAGHMESLLLHGGVGWYDDILATHKRWIREEEIKNIQPAPPTVFWHGQEDGFVSAEHAFQLAASTPYAHPYIVPGAHFSRIPSFASAVRHVTYWARQRQELGEEYW